MPTNLRFSRSARLLSGPLFLLLAASLVLFPAACSLLSGTLRIEHDFADGPQRSTSTNVKELRVDLNQDSDFRSNKDKIKSIDEVGFVFRAHNHLGTAVHGEIYISPSALPVSGPTLTAQAIRGYAPARRVLKNLVLQPDSTDVSYDQSLSLEENQAYLHSVVQGGTFYLYGIADESDFDLTIDKLTAVVVVTFEL